MRWWARQDDGAVRERVRADRRQHHRVHGREHDGAARRQTVGGRAGRRRDDEPVRAVAGRELPVHRHLEPDDAAHGRLGDDHVVERDVLGRAARPGATPCAASIMRSSMTSPPAQVRLERREQLVHGQRGQKAEAAQVDAEDGHAEVADEPRHREQRAVAAQHHQQVDLARQVGLAAPPSPPRLGAERRRLLLEERLEAAARAPLRAVAARPSAPPRDRSWRRCRSASCGLGGPPRGR